MTANSFMEEMEKVAFARVFSRLAGAGLRGVGKFSNILGAGSRLASKGLTNFGGRMAEAGSRLGRIGNVISARGMGSTLMPGGGLFSKLSPGLRGALIGGGVGGGIDALARATTGHGVYDIITKRPNNQPVQAPTDAGASGSKPVQAPTNAGTSAAALANATKTGL